MNSFAQAEIKPGTKILFANVPADGHFNPLTGIAAHLKSIGCDVRWYTAKKFEPKIASLGIPFYPFNKAFDISADPDPDKIFPERAKKKSQLSKLKFDMIHVFILRGPEYYADIQEIYQEFPFSLLVADLTFAGIPFVKEKMNIPVVSINVIPLPETSKDLGPMGLGLTPATGFFGKKKQNILRFIADKVLFAHPYRVMKKVLASYSISPGGSNVFDILIKKSTLSLQSGTPGFEYQRSDISSHVHFVGPLLPFSSKKIKTRWSDERLLQYKKVILVTQGTVENDVTKLLVPTLEAFKNSDYLVIATTGGGQTNELRKQYPQANIIIEDFIAFEDVMPFAHVYVTNGGYGGVLLSIKNGLPMVAAGIHEGKNEIAARIGYFKLGLNLKTEKPTAEQIKKAVTEVLEKPEYNHAVSALGMEFQSFNPTQLVTQHIASLLKPAGEIKRLKQRAFVSEIYE